MTSEKDIGGNKVYPKGGEESQAAEDEYDEDGIELNNSEVDAPTENDKAQKNPELDEQNGEQTEEPEWKDKFIRVSIDKFMNSIIGEFIQKFIGAVSIISSIAFVIMTEYDWSSSDPCCMKSAEFYTAAAIPFVNSFGNYGCPKSPTEGITCDLTNDCLVGCDQFYYSRMPINYEFIDIFICLVYLVLYILMIFISPSRYNFFISNQSIREMFIIIPVLIFPYECDKLGLFLKATSRMLRIYKVEIFLRSKDTGEDSNVSRQIK